MCSIEAQLLGLRSHIKCSIRHTWPVAPPGEHRENISIPAERSPDSTALKGNTVPAMGWSYTSYNTLPCSYSTNTSSSHHSHCHDVLAGLEASRRAVHAHACLYNTQAHVPLPPTYACTHVPMHVCMPTMHQAHTVCACAHTCRHIGLWTYPGLPSVTIAPKDKMTL